MTTRHSHLLSTVVLLLLAASVYAHHPFTRLDGLISKRDSLTRHYCDSIRSLPGSLFDDYSYNRIMQEAYSAFCYDSAYHYAQLNMLMIDTLPTAKRIDTQLSMMHILSVGGLFNQAEQIKEELEVDSAIFSKQQYIQYLSYSSDLYLYLAEFTHTPYSEQYMEKVRTYRRLIIQHTAPESYEYSFAIATTLSDEGQHDEAIQILENLLLTLHSGTRQYSITTSTLGYFNRQAGNTEQSRQYFTLSAISDIEANIRETSSLRALALQLFEEGNIRRAYDYLYVSAQDAQLYNSRLRIYQTGQITPLIISAWQKEQERSSRLRRMLFIFVALMIIALTTTVIAVSIAFKKVSHTKKVVESKNSEIQQINTQLQLQNLQIKESNKIKLEYLSRFMQLSSNYIIEFEQNRNRLNRLMMDGKTAEVAKLLKSNQLEQTNVRFFHRSFDNAFLNIYPSFINAVNNLLTEDNQLFPKEGEKLTTELRILALLRLGITDNQEIADILRSSITTIYTYRSRLRLKAVNSATFEQDIMHIDANLEE